MGERGVEAFATHDYISAEIQSNKHSSPSVVIRESALQAFGGARCNTEEMILTRLRSKEVSDLEQALHRKSIQFGIADRAVDRLHDLVIS